MLVLVTRTPSLEEQMHESQKKHAEKEVEIADFATLLENREREKANKVSSTDIVVTP